MRFNVCALILLLGVALAWAGPTPKLTQKNSLEDSKQESKKQELNIEEAGEDKSRAKKSAASFCVEIKPGSSQPIQVPCKGAQTTTQNTILAVQNAPATQKIQTLNVAQPSFVQSVPQSSIVLPQQVLQPFQTFQLVQSASQPCFQATPSASIIQPVPQSNTVQETLKPNSKPNPNPTQPITEQPKLAHIEQFPEPLPVPQETITVLPIGSSYHEPVITIPSSPMMIYPKPESSQIASIMEIPSVSPCNNPLHHVLTPCTCQNNMVTLSDSNMEPMAIKVLPTFSYSSPYARALSSMVLPYNANMLSHILAHDHVDKARHHIKSHTHINLNAQLPYQQYQSQNNFQNTYQTVLPIGVETVPINQYPTKTLVTDHVHETPGITINAYPHMSRAANPMIASGSLTNKETVENSPLMPKMNDFMQSNKTPREISLNEFLPMKTEEIKQQDERGDAESYKMKAN